MLIKFKKNPKMAFYINKEKINYNLPCDSVLEHLERFRKKEKRKKHHNMCKNKSSPPLMLVSVSSLFPQSHSTNLPRIEVR